MLTTRDAETLDKSESGQENDRAVEINVACPAVNFRVWRLFLRLGLRHPLPWDPCVGVETSRPLASDEAEGEYGRKGGQRQRARFFPVLSSLLLLAALSCTEAVAGTYTTIFPLSENPISEAGLWLNGQADGLLWANCMTTNGFVWGNDYVQIVTWHGPQGVEGVGFDYIASTSGKGAPVDGDVVSASISNTTIRVYKNGSLILTGVNSEWSGGNPGVGFYGNTTPNVGFSRFAASDGLAPPAAPLLSAVARKGQLNIGFDTTAGQNYTIQQRTNLAATNWVTLTNLLGTGLRYQFSTPTTNTWPSLFFHVREP